MLTDAVVVAELHVRGRTGIVARARGVVPRLPLQHLPVPHPEHVLAGLQKLLKRGTLRRRRLHRRPFRQVAHVGIREAVHSRQLIDTVQLTVFLDVELQLIILIIREVQLVHRHLIAQIVQVGLCVPAHFFHPLQHFLRNILCLISFQRLFQLVQLHLPMPDGILHHPNGIPLRPPPPDARQHHTNCNRYNVFRFHNCISHS